MARRLTVEQQNRSFADGLCSLALRRMTAGGGGGHKARVEGAGRKRHNDTRTLKAHPIHVILSNRAAVREESPCRESVCCQGVLRIVRLGASNISTLTQRRRSFADGLGSLALLRMTPGGLWMKSGLTIPDGNNYSPDMSFRGTAKRFSRNPF